MIKPFFATASLMGAVALAGPGHAASLFDQTLTGAQMLTNSDVAFPTFQPGTTGSSITFSAGTQGDVLFTWDLLPAAPRGGLIFTLDLDYTPLTSDNDPQFGIVAGGEMLGITRYDNGSGGVFPIRGPLTATTMTASFGSEIAPGVGVVEPLTYRFSVGDEGSSATVLSYEEGASSFAPNISYFGSPVFFDTDDALSFAFTRANGDAQFGNPEQYQINSLRIRIDDIAPAPVPLPAALPMLLAGVLALAGVRRLSQRRA